MCSDSYPVVATSNDSYPFPRATDKSTEGWGGSGGVGGYHQHQTVSNGRSPINASASTGGGDL